MSKLTCPECGGKGSKVLYAGIPAKLCLKDSCSVLWGFFSNFIIWLPFNGWFFLYEESYLKALWVWLTDWNTKEE